MKTLKLTILSLLLLVTVQPLCLFAQTRGNGNVTTESRNLPTFHAIEASCIVHVFVSQGDAQSIKVETDSNLQPLIITKVENGTLELSCDHINNPTKVNVYVTAPRFTSFEASGAAKIKGETPINGNILSVNGSGASKIDLNLDVQTLNSETSGASHVILGLKTNNINTEVSGAGVLEINGSAYKHTTEVSGAGSLKGYEFITDNTSADISGAGKAKITARKQLKASLSGAGNVSYYDNGVVKSISKPGDYTFQFSNMDDLKSVKIDKEVKKTNDNDIFVINNDDDTITVKINKKKIVEVTDDTVKVAIGKRIIKIGDNGSVDIEKSEKPKFNGHWAGVELGINGWFNDKNEIDFPAGYEYLDLKYPKSINVNINVLEQNFNIIKNTFGLTTGLGLSFNNYRFDNNVILTNDKVLGGYHDLTSTRSYQKSKLLVTYLTLPLLLELQNNNESKYKRFHISGGVVGGLRLGSHTKVVYTDGSRVKDKNHDDFFLAPFKLDAMARIGWGIFDFYGTYGLTNMFRADKGPKVSPFSVGISLSSF